MEEVEAELGLVFELRKILQQSNVERKEVLLIALQNHEKVLLEGRISENLPYFVKNILSKRQIRDRAIDATKRHRVAGESLYYLWGLENE